jgi:hypothetical protein
LFDGVTRERIEEEDKKDDQPQPEEDLDDIIILMLNFSMFFSDVRTPLQTCLSS